MRGLWPGPRSRGTQAELPSRTRIIWPEDFRRDYLLCLRFSGIAGLNALECACRSYSENALPGVDSYQVLVGIAALAFRYVAITAAQRSMKHRAGSANRWGGPQYAALQGPVEVPETVNP